MRARVSLWLASGCTTVNAAEAASLADGTLNRVTALRAEVARLTLALTTAAQRAETAENDVRLATNLLNAIADQARAARGANQRGEHG